VVFVDTIYSAKFDVLEATIPCFSDYHSFLP